MLQPIKPDHPSKKDYYSLSKEFNRKGLLYGRYRQLLRYQEQYGPIDLSTNKEDENTDKHTGS